MGIFSKVESKMEDTVEGAADKVIKTPISPVQIMKRAEKQMRREKMVGAGKQFAPTLYTVLVNPDDDDRLFGYYPTLAGETETYLAAKAAEQGMSMDGQPLVRFVVDDALKHGKFEVIAEMVAAPIVAQLRDEEMQRYGLAGAGQGAAPSAAAQRFAAREPVQQYGAQAGEPFQGQGAYGREGAREPLPYVPQDELDYSIDYGEYTFNSLDYDNYQGNDGASSVPFPQEGFDPRGQGAAQSRVRVPEVGASAGAAAAAGAGVARSRAGAGVAHESDTLLMNQVEAASPRAVCLVDMASNRSYELRGTRMSIGRESGNDIQVPDINASRRHAELTLNSSGIWVLTDLGSMNGTMVNNRTIAVQPLALGDRITVGTTVLMYTQA